MRHFSRINSCQGSCVRLLQEAYVHSAFAYPCQLLSDVSLSGQPVKVVSLTLRYAPFPSAFHEIVSNFAVEVRYVVLDLPSGD